MQSSDSDFYRKKYITSLAYIVGVLLFLLPFVEVKCNDAPFAENTGIGLASGKEYKVTGQAGAIKDGLDKNDTGSGIRTSKENGKFYVTALIALLLGVTGAIISLSRKRKGAATMIIGALAAISLMILALQLKNDVKDQMQSNGENYRNAIRVTVDFTAWFYLSVISFLAASFLGFKQSSIALPYRQPPGNAPQIPIKNPGEQSEFPSSPDESELER
jgi:hypothetical protein